MNRRKKSLLKSQNKTLKGRIFPFVFLLAFFAQSVPSPALALPTTELNSKIRDFFQAKVKSSNQFIDNLNKTADGLVNNSIGTVSFYTRQGFSTLETLTGLSEQNQLYRYSKNNWQKTIGLGLGVIKGTKDFATGTVFLLAYLESSPARTIALAYNVLERPQEYKEKAISGGKTVAGILANPVPLVGGIYQWGKSTYVEAQKDPLKLGQLQGEVGVFGASLFVGGGQLKAIGAANKARKVAVTGSIAKNTSPVKKFNWAALIPDLPTINLGFGSAIPVGVGAGKGITAKITSGFPQTKNMVFTSSVADSGRLKAIKTSADGRFSITEYPFLVKSRGSILKSNDPKYAWIKDLTTTSEMRACLREWGKSAFTPWRNLLTKEEKAAIFDYTFSSKLVNPILRGINKDYNPAALEQIKLISSGLQKAELPEMYLFRGSGYRFLGDLEGLPMNELIGKTVEMKGFVSTSLFPNALFVDGVQIVIKVPRGVNGGYLGLDDLSRFPLESEVLLQYGQKLKILEVQQLPEEIWYKGGLHIVAEIIP
ncbi:MAG: ADP-ribosyltransferase [Peptococcia bacterium]